MAFKYIFFVFSLLFSFGVCTKAYASAPFCVEGNNISLQCYYYDAKQCREEARNLDANCKVNQDYVSLPEGYGNYCLVYSAMIVECIYLDYNACDADAKLKNGVCMVNYNKQQYSPVFEFQYDDYYKSF